MINFNGDAKVVIECGPPWIRKLKFGPVVPKGCRPLRYINDKCFPLDRYFNVQGIVETKKKKVNSFRWKQYILFF